MKNFIKIILCFLFSICVFVSCTTVDSGHRAALVEFGKVKSEVLDEGFHMMWPWYDAVSYDVRETTIKEQFKFFDKNNMEVPVEISIDRYLMPNSVNKIQSEIGKDQVEIKELNSLSAAAMQVIPQYSASELNLSKREEAENKIFLLLKKSFPEFYVVCTRVRITSVIIPKQIADAAMANATQIEINNLSEKKVIGAKNNLEAAKYDAESKAILSKPEMLALKKLEVEAIWANEGVSPYGENNVFGSETAIVKGLK